MTFNFKTILPSDGFEVHMLEDLTFRVTISDVSSVEGESHLAAQVWTNAYDNHATDGQWHSIDMTLLDKGQNRQKSTFIEKVIIVAKVDFEFKIKVRRKDSSSSSSNGGEWQWSDRNRRIRVLPMRSKDNWSSWLDYPDCQLILGPVYAGNEAAANTASQNGFSHLLCVAQELVIPSKRLQESPLVCHQVAMKEGVTNSIHEDHLQEAIEWIMRNWKSTHKLLIYSKHGFGRAGSTLVAFILSQNRAMPYEEGIRNYSFRRFIFPHSGLRQTVEKLYPRL